MSETLKAEQLIGMEELFSLGGFIEKTVRTTLEKTWKTRVQNVVYVHGMVGNEKAERYLYKQITNEIATYKNEPDKEDLYTRITNMLDAFFEDQLEAEVDESEDEKSLKKHNTKKSFKKNKTNN